MEQDYQDYVDSNGREWVYSYVAGSYVEYEPPIYIYYDDYDECEDCEFYTRELTQSGKTLDSDKEMSVMRKEC